MRSRSWFLGSRPASTVFSFDCRWHSLLVSIFLPPSVQLTLMRKNPAAMAAGSLISSVLG